MHPYLSHLNYVSPFRPNVHTYRKRAKAGGVLRQWLLAANRHWQRRKMIAVLEAMDDSILKDIGICRGDIPRVVDGFDDRELGTVPFAPAPRSVETEYATFLKVA